MCRNIQIGDVLGVMRVKMSFAQGLHFSGFWNQKKYLLCEFLSPLYWTRTIFFRYISVNCFWNQKIFHSIIKTKNILLRSEIGPSMHTITIIIVMGRLHQIIAQTLRTWTLVSECSNLFLKLFIIETWSILYGLTYMLMSHFYIQFV